MTRLQASFVALLLVAAVGLGGGVAGAQQPADGAYAHLLSPPMNTSLGFGAAAPNLTIAAFDPADPDVGIGLITAYAPTPLFLLDRVFGDELVGSPWIVVELAAGIGGLVFSGWAYGDALNRDQTADISFSAIAAAHALSWNLELTTRSLLRLALGTHDNERIEQSVPTILAFPLIGGAGISPRWTW
jgi:hypothetical protein